MGRRRKDGWDGTAAAILPQPAMVTTAD
jgi:hypothetical protein